MKGATVNQRVYLPGHRIGTVVGIGNRRVGGIRYITVKADDTGTTVVIPESQVTEAR